MGIMAAVLIGTGSRVMSEKPVSPDEVFWAAVQEARKMALKSQRDVALRFADDKDKGKQFSITNGETTKDFPVPKAGDLEVTFLVPQPGGNLIMIAGTAIETQKIPAVVFYGDGTCTAFRTQFFRDGATHIVAIDQWTCAPVLTADDANKR